MLVACASCATNDETANVDYNHYENDGSTSSEAEGRSEVALSADIPASGVDVVCQSWGYKYARCSVGFYIRRAYLVEQYSRTICIKGSNWDAEGIHIWVNGGCRGKFHADPEL